MRRWFFSRRLFQGGPVGPQDAKYTCPLGGTAHVFGTATSNAVQGATEVDLPYELEACVLLDRDTDPKNNYRLATTGTIRQVGTLAVQPTATTALGMRSDAVTITGTVYDPPVPYAEGLPAALQPGRQQGHRHALRPRLLDAAMIARHALVSRA